MRSSYFLFILLLLPFSLTAQQLEIFEPLLISDGGVFGFTLSPRGDHALWVKSNGARDTLIIMESIHARGRWQKPVMASFSGKPGVWKDIDPIFSPDGKMVLFQSNRPVEGKPDRKGFDIWAVKKIKNGWSEPFHLGNNINSDASESFASMTRSGNIYFMKENGDNQSDLYVSKRVKGGYQTPENLGPVINTKWRESNPYISPNEDYIIYFSNDPKGYGEVDLYISYKKNGVWTQPENLGQPINSADAEFCPFFHEPSKRLFFARQKRNGVRFIEDIYSVSFEVKQR